MGYFISNQHVNRRFDPSIHVIDGIYNIKDGSTLHILIANYTNKHVTFNKGQHIGHIEPSNDHMPQNSINSLTTQKMIEEHVQPNTFTPPLNTLLGDVSHKITKSITGNIKITICTDEICIRTTHLTKMQIDSGNSEPVIQRPYPITMKHYNWVRNETNKCINTQVVFSSHSVGQHLSL